MAKKIDRLAEEYIQQKKHSYIRYRLNCLEQVLALDIDDKWILDESVIQWGNLTIQNNILDEIALVFTSDELRKNMKRTLWENAKKDSKGLENFRRHVVSYLDSLE